MKPQAMYLKLLEDFADIPIDADDNIEIEFHRWERGTDRFEILEWFDGKIDGGVAQYVNTLKIN